MLALAALAMALTPLLALLGFESSLVLALLVSFASAHLGADRVWRARSAASPADGDLADARPARAVARLFASAWCSGLLLLALPLVILFANALRVKNCSLAAGFAWYALLPVLSAATGSAVGVAAGLAVQRRIAGSALSGSVVLGSIAWGAARFYTAPPVFGFDPFVAYFPGSLYDEELPVSAALLAARGLHLLGALAALTLAAALLDGRRLRLRLRPRAPGLAVAGALLALAWGIARDHLQPLIAPDARSLAATLGARIETAHVTLHYSPAGPWARDIDLVAEDAEFRLSQVTAAFGVPPTGRIEAYLFDSAEHKRTYLGASHTQVAKPWRREIYLQHDAWPHPVIKHELAHAVAGAFGDSIFHVSRRGLHINVALIEGAAVAADARLERVDLDQQVKIMRALGNQPPLDGIMGPGFLAYPSARAYTVAGSFCRFLLERRGRARFRDLYRSGGDFPAAYGASFTSLGEEWSRRIDATPLSERDQSLARERLARPGVFHKVCAHELAVRREEARDLAARGQHDGALARLASVCQDDPDDPEHTADLMDALLVARREPDATATAERLLAHPKASDGQKARALSLLGDQRLRRRDRSAADLYRRALALPLDEGQARQLRARLLATLDSPAGSALGRYLVGDAPGPRNGALDLLQAQRVIDAAPDRGLGHYLIGRQLAAYDRPAEARAALARARELGLPDDGFTLEARRLEAIAAFREGDRAGAKAIFADLATRPERQIQAEAHDWIARCEFREPARPTRPGAPRD